MNQRFGRYDQPRVDAGLEDPGLGLQKKLHPAQYNMMGHVP